MNTSPRLLLALASVLAALTATPFAAAPKVEETIIGPTDAGGTFVVSENGAHIAYVGMKGTSLVVTIDGVAGPEFDELFLSQQGVFHYAEKSGAGAANQGGLSNGLILFSVDGEHHAYVGRQGSDYVVIHDGKEIGRGPREALALGMGLLTITPAGKHVHWGEVERSGGQSKVRLLIDGRAGPWCKPTAMFKPVWNADESRYVYLAGQLSETGKPAMIVDGKDAGYYGQNPQFTADGKLLLTVGSVGGKTSLLGDGKPLLSGVQVTKFVVGPVGRRYAAIVRQQEGSKFIDYLYIDGKQVPDSHHAQDAWFSPDGKRYAALCKDPFGGTPAMIIDGDAYGFARVDAGGPMWTADSSKIIFTVGTAEGSFVAVNDDMYEVPQGMSLIAPVVAEQGDQFAWGTLGRGADGHSVIVGTKSVLIPGYYINTPFMFSSDGSRYGFIVSKYNRSDPAGFVIDGALQPGVAPGYLNRWITSTMAASIPFVFSPDNQHVAYVGRVGAQKNSLYVNQTPVQTNVGNVAYATFTPDSQHLFWMNMDPRWMTDVYVDGQMAVRANGAFFRELKTSFVVDPKGVATFLAQDGDVVKRYRITPAADTNLAALLAKGSPPVAAAPATPPPAATVTPPPPAATKPPATAATPPPPAGTKPATPPPAVAAGPAVALTWNDLVRRPEARPTTCTVNKAFNFQGGVKVPAGTKVNILEFEPAGLVVSTPDGRTNFNARPEETDVLAVASAAWSLLTPAQRELTYPALLQRMDLWPYKLKLLLPYTLDNVKTRVGDTALFLGLESGQFLVRHESSGLAFNVEAAETDLMAQARAILASETGAPGRLLEEFTGKLVSPINGQAVALDANARPKFVVMYMGAGWCGPCQVFSPELVKLLKEKAPKSADVALLYISGDRNSGEAKAYVTKIGIDWPTLYFKNRDQLPAFHSLFGDSIPQLVVTDRHGKVMVDSAKVGTTRALQQLGGLL